MIHTPAQATFLRRCRTNYIDASQLCPMPDIDLAVAPIAAQTGSSPGHCRRGDRRGDDDRPGGDELRIGKAGEAAAGPHELVEGADLDDPAGLEDEDAG